MTAKPCQLPKTYTGRMKEVPGAHKYLSRNIMKLKRALGTKPSKGDSMTSKEAERDEV